MADLIYMAKSKWTALLDAIRTKGGTSALMTADQAKAAVDAIQTGGGGYTANEIVSPTGVSGTFTFTAASVREYALAYCNGITEIIAPNLTSIATLCFLNMRGLTRASFPALTNADKKCMVNNTSLASVSLPALTTIKSDQFLEKSAIQYLVLPSFTGQIYNNSLRYNSSLNGVDLNAATYIGAGAFNGCSALSALVIRGGSVPTLSNVSAFSYTPFASDGSGGTLYVPQTLISEYQAATNWSTILGYANNSIQAIEGSIYETQYADGTPIPTT